MAATNQPEKPFFDDIVELLTDIAGKREEVAQLFKDAKEVESIGKGGVKVLRAAVRRHMMDAKKRKLESEADDLLHRLGHLRDTPLGEAALKAAE